MLFKPTADDLIAINRAELGSRSRVRDRHRLEAAVERPWQSAGSDDAYPTIDLKAAALMDSVSNGQPFVDGNKRTAVLGARLLYAFEGLYFTLAGDIAEAYDLNMHIAEQRPLDLDVVAERLSRHRVEIPSPDN